MKSKNTQYKAIIQMTNVYKRIFELAVYKFCIIFLLVSGACRSIVSIETENQIVESKPFNNIYIEKEMIFAVSWKYFNFYDEWYRVELTGKPSQLQYEELGALSSNDSHGVHIFDFSELLVNNNFTSLKNRWILRKPMNEIDFHCENTYNFKYFLSLIADSLIIDSVSNLSAGDITSFFPLNVSNRYDLPISKFMEKVIPTMTYAPMFINDVYLFKCKVTYQKVDSAYTAIFLPDLNLKLKNTKYNRIFNYYKISNKIKIYDKEHGFLFRYRDDYETNISISRLWRKRVRNNLLCNNEILWIGFHPYSLVTIYPYKEMMHSLHNQLNLNNNYIYAINELTPFPVDSLTSWLQNNPDILHSLNPKTIKYIKKLNN
jgi:hypothetical protein